MSAWRTFACGIVAFFLAGCFSISSLDGPYRCGDQPACAEGFVCWDGVCCHPDKEPLCVGYVYEGGLCADGGTAPLYFADYDRDGFGNDLETRPYC
jgi:hypothetical protein